MNDVRRRTVRSHARRAFTLIELLLVMVILAVLATLVLPRFTGRAEDTKKTAAAADISNIELALEMFEKDCGTYPSSQEGLAALINQPGNVQNWKGPYLKKGLPKDPWGNTYLYRCPGQYGVDFDLYSCGPNGQEGDDDDINNWTQR